MRVHPLPLSLALAVIGLASPSTCTASLARTVSTTSPSPSVRWVRPRFEPPASYRMARVRRQDTAAAGSGDTPAASDAAAGGGDSASGGDAATTTSEPAQETTTAATTSAAPVASSTTTQAPAETTTSSSPAPAQTTSDAQQVTTTQATTTQAESESRRVASGLDLSTLRERDAAACAQTCGPGGSTLAFFDFRRGGGGAVSPSVCWSGRSHRSTGSLPGRAWRLELCSRRSPFPSACETSADPPRLLPRSNDRRGSSDDHHNGRDDASYRRAVARGVSIVVDRHTARILCLGGHLCFVSDLSGL